MSGKSFAVFTQDAILILARQSDCLFIHSIVENSPNLPKRSITFTSFTNLVLAQQALLLGQFLLNYAYTVVANLNLTTTEKDSTFKGINPVRVLFEISVYANLYT